MPQRMVRPTGTADRAANAAAEPYAGEPDAQARISELEAALARSEQQVRDAQAQATRWERLLDAITDPIGVVSADSRLVYANAAYRTLFDRVPDGVIGHECFSAHPNPSGGRCETCPVPAAIASRRPAFVQTERPLRKTTGAAAAVGEAEAGESGTADEPAARRTFQRWTYPVITTDGIVEEVVETIKDVTEQERLREASQQAEALRAADRLKAELLGSVSHELRSPLAAIKGYAGTLLRYESRLPRSERHEFLTAISEASDRLETIIDKLLLMSQLETGLIGLSRAPVNLRQLAREAVVGIERRLPRDGHDDAEGPDATPAPRHRIAITDRTSTTGTGREAAVDTPGDTAVIVMGDRRLLRQALDEVLDNAVKYSPDGGLIEVSLRKVPAAEMVAPAGAGAAPSAGRAPAMLELRVRDEGRGIPDDHLGHVFDRFHRVDSGLTSAFGGLGLGLAICKRVIELHGGTVRVASEAGAGTEFSLLLPQEGGAA